MTSCFQGGKFDKVRLLIMRERRPFEHKLFQIIFRDFLFLQQLTIFNRQPQENKQHHSSTLIRFSHLFKLNIINAHSDYVTQFFSDKNTCLLSLTHLIIEYKTLTTVTNDFTNDRTRLNCSKIKLLLTCEPLVRSPNFVS
ncbi:unnamed protein product [Rotaria sp. Silwood2]|nr:unnamed protein product [Rotaria sp. Silwood2]CAF4564545.1 unnamed protein product [Rotaria sp. Silwood2]